MATDLATAHQAYSSFSGSDQIKVRNRMANVTRIHLPDTFLGFCLSVEFSHQMLPPGFPSRTLSRSGVLITQVHSLLRVSRSSGVGISFPGLHLGKVTIHSEVSCLRTVGSS